MPHPRAVPDGLTLSFVPTADEVVSGAESVADVDVDVEGEAESELDAAAELDAEKDADKPNRTFRPRMVRRGTYRRSKAFPPGYDPNRYSAPKYYGMGEPMNQ